MIIFPRRTAHRLGVCSGRTVSIRLYTTALRHEFDEIGPDPSQLRRCSLLPGRCGLIRLRKSTSARYTLPTPDRTVLIHQQCGDRPGRAVDPAPRTIRIGICSQWILDLVR
jgi:hypothetical protein